MTFRDFFYRALNIFLDLTSVLSAPVISRMARTGAGSDRCLKYHCLPLPVHFYSPVPDIEDLKRRNIWEKKSPMRGIDFHTDKQLELLKKLGQRYGSECNWSLSPTDDPTVFYLDNNSFSYGCAATLHSVIRTFKPRHVIEIGSGNSSLVINNAISLNKKEKFPAEYTIIDPFPSEIVTRKLANVTNVIPEKVEATSENVFDQLDENDLLFIDSGHVVKTGGDVNYLILDILPRLRPGVIIHFHDIGLPYEYPRVYFTNPQFRVFWTEAYLLQAFLCQNPFFEVMLAMNFIMTEKPEEFQNAFASFNPEVHRSISGSFWIRRRT